MKKVFSLLMIFIVIFIASCKNDDDDEQLTLIGCWSTPAYADNLEGRVFITYKRTKTLSDNGIEFLENGSFIERKNAGWCGTPPITFENFTGNWQEQNNSLQINVAYWGGMEHRIWKIIDVTNTTLSIEVISNEYVETYLRHVDQSER